ncbi:MAG: arylsulfatase A-like enzyme [Granulosicoccus sp.]|jgi:arylsulfatase A-like enzyme
MAKNILLVVIDQFRADCLAVLSSEAMPASLSQSVELPNLRALMQDGMTFNQHYTVTTPCGPSRASLLTGLYAMNHRSVRNGTPLGNHHKSLGNYMRAVGYEPTLFGYTDTSADPDGRHPEDPELKDYEGMSQGFAEAVRMRADSGGPWVGYLKQKGYPMPEKYWELYRPVLDASTASSQDPLGSPIRSPALYKAEDSDTAFLTDRTIEALWAKTNVPWFSMVTYIRPHPPLVAPSPFNTMVDPAALPKPAGSRTIDKLKATHPFYEGFFSEPSNTKLYIGFDGDHENLSDQHSAELRAVYLGLAMEVDEHIGRLVDFLKESGQYEDTLIVVTADHGEMLGDHGLWGKNSPMDPALRVPLIIRDPNKPSSHGTSTDMLTESVDIAPTLLDWCDGENVPALDGRSLMPFINGSTPSSWRTHVFAEVELGEPDVPTRFERTLGLSATSANYAVLRDHLFKYVHFNGGLPPMLFNMQDDPSENHDLAQNAEYANVLRQFASRMLDHRMSHAEHSLSNLKLTDQGLFSPSKRF